MVSASLQLEKSYSLQGVRSADHPLFNAVALFAVSQVRIDCNDKILQRKTAP